jgi:uncharacterized protein (TIGR00369 family)
MFAEILILLQLWSVEKMNTEKINALKEMYKERMRKDADEIRRHVEASIQRTTENGLHFFGNFIGLNFIGFEGDEFVTEVESKPHIMNTANVLQGGATATIADLTMGFMLLERYGHVVTLEMKTNYISPGVGKLFRTKARVVGKTGRHIICECRTMNEKGTVIAYSSGTFVQRKSE